MPAADLLVLGVALRQIAQLDSEIKAVEEEVIRRGKSLRGVRRLLQVHGLNLLSAISLLAEVGDVNLFDTSKQLVSYAGLATSTRQSSETTSHGGITKRGRKRLRTVVIQAVLSMVNRTETPLMEFYRKKKREKGAGKAICATARKLLTIIFVLLKKELDYWYLEDRLSNRKPRALDAAAYVLTLHRVGMYLTRDTIQVANWSQQSMFRFACQRRGRHFSVLFQSKHFFIGQKGYYVDNNSTPTNSPNRLLRRHFFRRSGSAVRYPAGALL